MKLIGSAHALDDAALARFRRENATLAKLSHPNLVGLLDHGGDAELGPYLVLPLLPGVTCASFVEGARCGCASCVCPYLGPTAITCRTFTDRKLRKLRLSPI